MYRTTRRIQSLTSYKAHLAMAVKLLDEWGKRGYGIDVVFYRKYSNSPYVDPHDAEPVAAHVHQHRSERACVKLNERITAALAEDELGRLPGLAIIFLAEKLRRRFGEALGAQMPRQALRPGVGCIANLRPIIHGKRKGRHGGHLLAIGWSSQQHWSFPIVAISLRRKAGESLG